MEDFKGTMPGGPGVGLHQLRVGALGSLYVEVILKLRNSPFKAG
jgi:hypothetical protein